MPLARNDIFPVRDGRWARRSRVPISIREPPRSANGGRSRHGGRRMSIASPRHTARAFTTAAALLLLALAWRLPGARGQGTGDPAPMRVAWTERTMGTYGRVTLVTRDSAAAWPEARVALAALVRVDSLMSNWTTTSEVARLNREAGSAETRVQPEVGTVLEAALRLWRESDGAYDITVEPLVRAWGF